MQKNLKVNFNRQSAREAFVQNTQQTSQPLDLAEVYEGLANKKEVHVQHLELCDLFYGTVMQQYSNTLYRRCF